MKLKKLYDFIVQEGINADPRGRATVERELARRKLAYESLEQKTYFHLESLKNPYNDSGILNGTSDVEIKTAMIGIDIDTAELLLIDRLNSKNKEKIDLAISHHPQGSIYANFHEVMDMQADIYSNAGVPINISENLVEERKREIGRRVHSANHQKNADAAKLLGIPFMCVHSPADNHVVSYLDKLMEQKKPESLKDIMDILNSIEEYKISSKQNNPPSILFGKPSSRPGKILVDMTGGTEGPKDIIDNLAAAGCGTIIGMHFSEELYKKLQGKNINCIVAGHIASDNLGLNLLMDKVEKLTKIKILACSGFRRIKR